MRKYTLILILFFSAISTYAQKQLLTLDKAILGGRDLALANWSNVQWSEDQNVLLYTKTGSYLYHYDAKKMKTDSINLLESLNTALLAAKLKELKNIPAFETQKNYCIEFTASGLPLKYDIKNNKLKIGNSRPAQGQNVDYNKASDFYAFTFQQGLYIKKFNGDEVLVAQGNDSIVYGESVHRQEFGISNGTFWSPNGTYLAFYRMDQSMVTQYPVFDLSTTPATMKNIYYPMAGAKSHHVTLGVFDLETSKVTYLKTGGDPEHYLTNVTWSPDEKIIYIAEINRDQNHTTFNAYDAASGQLISALYEEKSNQYTEPLEPFTFIPASSNLFITKSKRDGWNSLYLYNTDGTLVRQLTSGVEVSGPISFDVSNKNVYFQGIPPNSIDVHLFKTEINTGKTTMLTSGPGLHQALQSYDGSYMFDKHIAIDKNLTYTVSDASRKKANTIFTASDPLVNYRIGDIHIDTLQTTDGTPLFARTIYPADFDPQKKYPAIIYVYGGPHAQMIRNTRNGQAQLWMQVLANEGFIVFTVDNRGSSNRGMNFENGIHRNLGELEMEDQMLGYDYLISRSYVDEQRIGVHGWSYGGFMTISLMTRQPGKFKTAVAGGPVTDWNMYEIMYTERYMDTPQQNPEGYNKANTFNYIDKLNGPMLLIHGTSDDVVVWQQSLNYIKTCVEKGKQIDYFVYPGHAHNVLGKDRVHLIQKITDYFKNNL